MENWQLAVTLLVTLLVGAMIPLLVQLMLTLRNLGQLVRHADAVVVATRPNLERAIDEVGTAAAHLNQVSAGLERLKTGATILTMLGTTVLPAVLEALNRSKEQKTNHVEQGAES